MLYADALICLRSMEFIADHSVTIGSGDLRATLAPAHTTKNRTADRTLRGIVKQHDRSWFALIAFFLLTTLASSLVFAAVFAAVTAAIGDSAQTGDELQVDPLVPGQNFPESSATRIVVLHLRIPKRTRPTAPAYACATVRGTQSSMETRNTNSRANSGRSASSPARG